MQLPAHSWPVSGGIPVLSEDEVHVWCADLDQEMACVRQLAKTLCDAERARARRFRFARDRNRFIVCRGILRQILGGYLNIAAGQLRFCYGRHGKPRLAGEVGAGALRFNLSHSDGMSVLAFARDREIGIDLERVRADVASDEIAAQFFSRRENELLRDFQGTDRHRAFFMAWTCKEAYVKAKGGGLSLPFDRVEVTLFPPVLRRVGEDEQEASRWSLQELGVGDEYAAALAVEGRDWRLVCRRWQGREAE